MPLSLLNHSALALFPQCTRILTSARSTLASVPFGFVLVRVRVLARNARAYTSARSIGFCVIWVCISSSSRLDWTRLGYRALD